jgi:hypothetical protein
MLRLLLAVAAARVVCASIEEVPLPPDIQSCFDRQYKKGRYTYLCIFIKNPPG